jgi:hypothetical protein
VLESITAIFILSLSIASVFYSISQSLVQSQLSQDEVRAFFLAQEAIDTIRNKRDINQLTKVKFGTGNWLDNVVLGAGGCPFSTAMNKNTCTVDATNFQISNCGGDWGSCPVLRQNTASFLYGYDANWPVTNFKREIQIESISADEIAVTVRVYWSHGMINRDFKVKTFLLNWI